MGVVAGLDFLGSAACADTATAKSGASKRIRKDFNCSTNGF
jgi:hypothetical protein